MLNHTNTSKKRKSRETSHIPEDDDIRSGIVTLFRRTPGLSIKFNALFGKLKLRRNEKSALRDSLSGLIEENLLIKKGKFYELRHKGFMIEGKVVMDRELEHAVEIRTEKGTERVRVRKRNMQTALVGDEVEVTIIEFTDRDEKEAVVEKIIKRAKHSIVGIIEYSRDFAFVIPDDKKFKKDIYIHRKNTKEAENGDRVVCEIIGWEYQDLSPEGKVVEVLGKAGDVKTEFRVLIKKFGLVKQFPKKVTSEIKEMEKSGNFLAGGEEIKRRIDLRGETTFTIDPEDAKDFDDAVSIGINEKGNYVLGVHIADVSHYVKEGSETDMEAYKRGTSVYLMNDVVPMLPEKLSNDVCSLKEKVDRLTFSVFAEVDPKGEVQSFNIEKSVIHSKKRFTYEEVQNILEHQKGKFLKEINMMNDLHKLLFRKRVEEGSLDFETPEVKVEIDARGFIQDIKPKVRLESMRMIEDFMLLANKCVTLYIQRQKSKPPFVYRVHDLPDRKKIRELSYFVKQFGITLNPESKRSIQKMLEQIRGRAEEYLINDITIRSMAKAVYSEENIGHYGLGFENYTHFTSPIRRYPDLIVHRILYDVLKGMNQKKRNHYREILPDACRQSTEMEINSVQAEREAIKILQLQFMEKHVGDVFRGIVSGVSEYGIYIEIMENLIEGMVRLKDLRDDYYILDEKNFQLIGRSRKKTYRIGDKVRVKVLKVDKVRKWIDFTIIS